jgi:hypothetical protein
MATAKCRRQDVVDVYAQGRRPGSPLASGYRSHGILWRDIMKVAGESEQTPWKPLGDRVVRQPPTLPEWQPLPHTPSIEVNKQGQLRTNLPLPK